MSGWRVLRSEPSVARRRIQGRYSHAHTERRGPIVGQHQQDQLGCDVAEASARGCREPSNGADPCDGSPHFVLLVQVVTVQPRIIERIPQYSDLTSATFLVG